MVGIAAGRTHRALPDRQVDECQKVHERQALADEQQPARAAVVAAPERGEQQEERKRRRELQGVQHANLVAKAERDAAAEYGKKPDEPRRFHDVRRDSLILPGRIVERHRKIEQDTHQDKGQAPNPSG